MSETRDISKPADAEHELRQAAARYEAILASTLDPVITIDFSGTVRSASESVRRVFGWSPEELVGRNISVLMQAPYRSEHDGYLKRYRETGRTWILGHTREFEAVRKDGSVVPIELSVSRVDIPGETAPLFTGIVHDITERRQAELALAESEGRLRDMLMRIELLCVVLDREGRLTFCNDYLLGLTGWQRDEVINRSWFDMFVPAGERERVSGVFDHVLRGDERGRRHDNDVLTRDGEIRSVSWTNAHVLNSAGAVVGTLGLGVDVTDQRLNDAELARYREHLESLVEQRSVQLQETHEQLRVAERLVSIGTLAAGLGHDMNNVLLPIRSRLDALGGAALPEEPTEHLDAVRKMIAYLQQLADGLRLLALDPNDARASTETTDVRAWWQQVGSLLGRGVAKSIEFSAEWEPDLPNARIPPHRLTQAMLNLIVNASEATGDGGFIRVWARADEHPGFVGVGVTDNGHGMTPDVLRHAQDPFFTTKKRGLGTGLGLSLAERRAAGGTLHIESAPDEGTTVTLRLPAATADTSPAVRRQVTAVVTVADPRMESLISTMLAAASVSVLAEGLPEHLTGACIWITEASSDQLATARAFLSHPRRRIVVLGEASATWREIGAVAVLQPTDVKTLRERLTAAITECSGDLS